MKIYIGHSRELNYKKDLYLPIRESHLNIEHEIIFPHELDHETNSFSTKEIIKTCDAMIAEVSFPSTSLGIEIGWANAFNRPLMFIHRKGSKISSSLKIVSENFLEYTDKEDLIKKLSTAFSKLQK